MKLVVGLGNPGSQYEKTRHNAGFMVVDRLVRAHAPGSPAKGSFSATCYEANLAGQKCLFLKPNTYMNRSGQSVGDAVRFYKVDPTMDLLVLVDDIYLPVGDVRLKPAGGDAGHNGLADIRRVLASDQYPRLRIGVGAKPPLMDQADWVLSRFSDEEAAPLSSAIEKAAKAAETFVSRGIAAAMNQCNAPDTVRAHPSKPARGDAAKGTTRNDQEGNQS